MNKLIKVVAGFGVFVCSGLFGLYGEFHVSCFFARLQLKW